MTPERESKGEDSGNSKNVNIAYLPTTLFGINTTGSVGTSLDHDVRLLGPPHLLIKYFGRIHCR
jgi:hypothetical protein